MKTLLVLFCGLALGAMAQEARLIPVRAWPRVLNMDGKQIVNPDASICVRAGYRLIPVEKPAIPPGKVVESEQLVQDEKRAEYVKWVVQYADVPAPLPPEVLTNVPAARVTFQFTTNGEYRGMTWRDSPGTGKTNGVER